jgi:hypothetical protein
VATFTNAFDSFQVFYYGNSNPPTAITYSAVIQVYQGSVFAGRIVFYPLPGPPPPNGVINPLGTNVPSISYLISSFEDVWGILRHTRPLYLFLDDVTKVGFLATSGFEPIGGP